MATAPALMASQAMQPLLKPTDGTERRESLSTFIPSVEAWSWSKRFRNRHVMQEDIIILQHVIDRMKSYCELLSQQNNFADMWRIFFRMVEELARVELSFPLLQYMANDLNEDLNVKDVSAKFDKNCLAWLESMPEQVHPVLKRWSVRGASGRHLFNTTAAEHDKQVFEGIVAEMEKHPYTEEWARTIRAGPRRGDLMCRCWYQMHAAAKFNLNGPTACFASLAAQPHDEQLSEQMVACTAKALTEVVKLRAVMSRYVHETQEVQTKAVAAAMSLAITAGQALVAYMFRQTED